MLAHGALLRKNFFSAEEIIAIVKDFRQAGLPPEEVAIMAYAQKVITQAHQVSEQDMAELREFGLSDEEILDITVASAARSFFSKVLDALNVRPDDVYLELEPELLQALTPGRPFSEK